jgi:hypothetical protein
MTRPAPSTTGLDIPDDVYTVLELLANGEQVPIGAASRILDRYPRSQPEPAWKNGDAALIDGAAALQWNKRWTFADHSWITEEQSARAEMDLISHEGRRVHPPRFAEHAAVLRIIAHSLRTKCVLDGTEPASLDRIATVLAGDNDE